MFDIIPIVQLLAMCMSKEVSSYRKYNEIVFDIKRLAQMSPEVNYMSAQWYYGSSQTSTERNFALIAASSITCYG